MPIESRKSLFFVLLTLVGPVFVSAQTEVVSEPPVISTSAEDPKAEAYYHYAMGHLFAELASLYGASSEYLWKAVDHYREALRLDPQAEFIVEELTDLT